MRQGKEGHLETDEGVGETERDMLVVSVGTETADGTGGDEEGDDDGLPEGEKQDAFDAEEFGHRAVRKVVRIFGHFAVIQEKTHRNGLRSSEMQSQNMARQYKLRQMLVL